jgi:hypothetical protein
VAKVAARRCLTLAIAATLVATMAGATIARGASPPQLGAVWASDVVATSARLHAEINPEGQATTYRFDFIDAAAYDANVKAGRPEFAEARRAPAGAEAGAGSGTIPKGFVQQLSGLAGDTAYRYRVVAGNASGSSASPTFGFRTQILGGGTLLLDDRGWELVSPVDKNGGQIQGVGEIFGGGVLQAAAGGQSVTYSSTASFGPEALGAPPASQYLSRRGGDGWSTANITAPTVSGAYGDQPDGVPYELFSDDLARGLLLEGRRCGVAEACPAAYSLWDEATGNFVQSPEAPDLRFVGSSPDLRHVVLSTCAALTPQATEVAGAEGCDPAYPNLYVWGEGELRLVNLLPGDAQGTPGAALGAQSTAISSDGERVFFAHGGDLFLRDSGGTVLVAAGATFETATPAGSFAFFTKEGHLHRFGPPSTLDLTPGGGVEGVLGASEDGARVYYEGSGGRVFLWDRGATAEVAAQGASSNRPPSTGTARVSADGLRLLFLSRASLTGYDNTDQVTGEADTEVFLYDLESGRLACPSCNPTGARPLGPSSIPGAIANGTAPVATRAYKPRVLGRNGRRIFFESGDALALQDTNRKVDVYEWEAQGEGSCLRPEGCLGLISSGRASSDASFVDASADGSDAFFLTDRSLVPSDPGLVDVYDARVGGGFPLPPSPIPCQADACQSLPSEPEDPEPSTLRSGPGNPPVRFKKKRRKHHHRQHHRGPNGQYGKKGQHGKRGAR